MMKALTAVVASLFLLETANTVEALNLRCQYYTWDSEEVKYICKDEDENNAVTWSGDAAANAPDLMYLGENRTNLGVCQGRCLSNDDCQDDLICILRDPTVSIINGHCANGQLHRFVNYCYYNETEVQGEFVEQHKQERNDTAPNPPIDQLVYKGEPPFTAKLAECEGDCDSDWNCDFGLNCYKRSDDREIPGCAGVGIYSVDYCYKPPPDTLVLVMDAVSSVSKTRAFKCEGSCVDNEDCFFGLECFQRDNYESVPGCEGLGAHAANYCYDPNDVTEQPTTLPTDLPTAAPTALPDQLRPTAQPAKTGTGTLSTTTRTSRPTQISQRVVVTDDPPEPTPVSPSLTTESPTAGPTTEALALSPTAVPDPTAVLTETPVATPTRKPITTTPTVEPIATPTLRPRATPSAAPSGIQTVTPSGAPTTTKPTLRPIPKPTLRPRAAPTMRPTQVSQRDVALEDSPMPTALPTVPSSAPIKVVSLFTRAPKTTPTLRPRAAPTARPTQISQVVVINNTPAPTTLPALPSATASLPTGVQIETPTVRPKATVRPTQISQRDVAVEDSPVPTALPTLPSSAPMKEASLFTRAPRTTPTLSPRAAPTAWPRAARTARPTQISQQVVIDKTPAPTTLPALPSLTASLPSEVQIETPTVRPKATVRPTQISQRVVAIDDSPIPTKLSTLPSITPTVTSSAAPTVAASSVPSASPTIVPSEKPTVVESFPPTRASSAAPTLIASSSPSAIPSSMPSDVPSNVPSSTPAEVVPSVAPTKALSDLPSTSPTALPSEAPSVVRSSNPTMIETEFPSDMPSSSPSHMPSDVPSLTSSNIPSTSPTSGGDKKLSNTTSLLLSDVPSTPPSLFPFGVSTTPPVPRVTSRPTLTSRNVNGGNVGRASQPPSRSAVPFAPGSTGVPSDWPSAAPSDASLGTHSDRPSRVPSSRATSRPTLASRNISGAENDGAAIVPSDLPSLVPSSTPSDTADMPSDWPSEAPSRTPTRVAKTPIANSSIGRPDRGSSPSPIAVNVTTGTSRPTTTSGRAVGSSSDNSSAVPSDWPSQAPSDAPSVVLSGRTPLVSTDLSGVPSDWPSMAPSDAPVNVLSDQPSLLPSDRPSSVPSDLPSLTPSGSPSALRSDWPSVVPLDVAVKDLVPSAVLSGQSSEASPTAVPTALSCNSDPDKRASAILLELVRSGIDMELPLSTETYYWLIGEEVDCPETRNILQRFTMGTLYFGLTGWNCTSEADEACFLSIYDECSWVGVSCNNNGQVTSLRLDDLELSGNLPDLSRLSMLVELDMDSNTLSGTLPTWIGELPYLEIVDFDSNKLTGTIPTEIGNASKLRVIDLDGNQLSGSIPEEVGSLMSLYFLQLDFNLLTGSIPASLVDIPTLEYLSIIGNNFTDPLVIEFCNRQLEVFANCDMCVVAECCTACLTLP